MSSSPPSGQTGSGRARGRRVGGQAVFEGVMMRGPERWVVAVRRPDNRIGVMVQAAPTRSGRGLARIPFIRGIVVAWESLRVGLRALTESAKVVSGDDDAPTKGAASRVGAFVMVVVALALAIGMFFVVPLIITRDLLDMHAGSDFWLVEGGLRVAMLLVYLWALALVPDMRRMMQFHAAEHMVLHAYERGDPIEPGSAADKPRHHVRCSTALLLAVMVIAIVVFAAIGDRETWVLVATRVLGVPAIVGVAYEVMRIIAAAQGSLIGRALALPGNLLQRFTTRRPDAEHLEVACVALRRLLGVDTALADSTSRAEILT
jgi:uncharacterized protein YqhQ